MNKRFTSSENDSQYRVLHIITRLIVGGAQENTLYTAELLNRDLYDVKVLCGRQTGSEGSLIEDAVDRNIELIFEDRLVREISPLKDIAAFFKLVKHIKKGNYQIVHTHSSKAGIIGRWAAWFAGTPVIVHTVHGWGFHDQQHWIMKWLYVLLEKATLPITNKLIAVAHEDIKKGVSVWIGEKAHYCTIRSGIDIDKYATPRVASEKMRDQLGIPHNAPVVGTVTRLSSQKAPWNFVAMAKYVNRIRDDVHFVLVGDGPLRDSVKELIRKNELTDRFHLTGLRMDVPELLGCFDVFALSSLWEGLPRVLPQAMAAGVPVVASAVNGSVEIITDFVNGRLVPPNDPRALADMVLELIDNPELSEKLKTAASNTVEEYSVEKMVGDIDRLYIDLMKRKGLLVPRQRPSLKEVVS